jgi:sugar lactone lactonase YvrE
MTAICFYFSCFAFLLSQQASASPSFHSAQWPNGTQVDSAEIGNRTPLILIHGILEDSSIWTNVFTYYENSYELRNNFKPYVFEYHTHDSDVQLPEDPGDVPGLGYALGNFLQQWYNTPTSDPKAGFNGNNVVILAHSMGGLVARAMMGYYYFSDHQQGGNKVSMLLTLATPHHGTALANELVTPNLLTESFNEFVYHLYLGFAFNMEWDCYDRVSIDNYCAPGIAPGLFYSKIVAYGAVLDTSLGQNSELNDAHWVLCQDHYCNSDGVVPIESALFYGAPVVTRQVDGSCDHLQILLGNNTVDNGFPIFGSIAEDLETAVPYGPPPPVISVVSPSALPGLPLPQTQLIRIIGSGFTSISTLTFNDGVDSPFTGRVPIFISANELDYNITVGPNAANWTVQVVNGSQQSNLGTFSVTAQPPPSVGSLCVTLQPAGAVSAGAQWEVDNTGYNNSGQVVGYLTPGLHTVSFKPVAGYTAPASHSVSISGGNLTTEADTYTAVAPSTYTLTLNQGGNMGYIVNQPFGTGNGSIYSAGAAVQLTAYANGGYHFVSWNGDVSGTANPTTITMNGNKTVGASFASGDTNMGTVVVTILPPEAATAGVTWGLNDSDFRASGTSYTYYPETVWVFLHATNDWIGYGGWVTLTAGQITNYTFAASYTNGSIVGTDPRTYYTLAGSAGNSGSADGTNTSASFNRPWSVAVDTNGNIFVADENNNLIRKVSAAGVVSTVAGVAGVAGSADGPGSSATFNYPNGIAVDSAGYLYVADWNNSTVRKITPDGVVSTLAGLAGNNGSADGAGSAARFYFPSDVAVDTNGNVYVADSVNETIRKITPSGVVSTLAGLARSYGSTDGTGSAARFHDPTAVAVDASGNVYVADQVNQTVRKVTPAGVVTTLAGFPESAGAADGTGNAARFQNLSGVAVDANGNIYVADTGNNAIRKVTQGGVVTTLAGQSGSTGSVDGVGMVVRFDNPGGVAVDSSGDLFVADSLNNTIRATLSLTNKINQSIVFPSIPEHSAGDAPFAITATASSGLPVYFNVISGPAVSSNNVVTLLGGGTVTVVAWQPGDSNYNPAPTVQQSFDVATIPQFITFGPLSQQTAGDAPFPLAATASSGLPVTFTLVSGPASLSGNIVILTGGGTVTVTASQPGNGVYAAALSVSQSFFVVPPPDTVGDGIPDAWRAQYFGGGGTNTNSVSCATCDADGTGQNNMFKYIAGLDPTNPASVFVLQIQNVPNQPTQKNLIYGPAADGRTYVVESTTNLVGGVWSPQAVSAPLIDGTQVTVTDMNATGRQKFYRVDIYNVITNIVIQDSVGDGIADSWRAQYFPSVPSNTTNSQSCATCDADGTGQNNFFKYIAGLDPTNPASVFVLGIAATNQPLLNNLFFTPLALGRTYAPQFSTDLVSGVWLPLTAYTGPLTNGNQVTITDTNPIPPQEFYRINISLP